ncbi:MAG TPA: hypothetical protein VH475_16160 [Tepidisphaeraceae bacterium]|jgi:hypothetical protein
MFGFFRPHCPIDIVTRAWVHRRWRWLTDEFGADLMIDATTVLPTAEFFPDEYDGSEQAVRTLVDRVCGYMQVPADRVELDFYSESGRPHFVDEQGRAIGGTAGLYLPDHDITIHLERSGFARPMELVGTVAHELAHARTLGEGRCYAEEYDNELLTDLTVVFHGLGIFLANVPRHWPASAETWPGTDVFKPEYMTTPMYGYALAYRCWLREEPMPVWRRHLAPGVRAEFKHALRFLQSGLSA